MLSIPKSANVLSRGGWGSKKSCRAYFVFMLLFFLESYLTEQMYLTNRAKDVLCYC